MTVTVNAELCLVLDLGSPYVQGLARGVRKRGVYTRIEPAAISAERLSALGPRAVILVGEHYGNGGGGPVPVTLRRDLVRAGIPILAVGPTSPLAPVAGVDEAPRIHWLTIDPDLPDLIPGSGGPEEPDALGDFLFRTARFDPTWTMARFLDEAVPRLRAQIGAEHVLLGLSGGVDSMVTAALLHRAVGAQLSCVLVDNGFLRDGEREAVEAACRTLLPGRLHVIDAGSAFLAALAGAAPGEKRRIIRREFRSVFARRAAQIPRATFLAQGIIYSDLLGSAPALDAAAPERISESIPLKPILPLGDLFKDEVRELGTLLGVPQDLLRRQPFPGPGLAVRCLGQVDQPRLDTLRAADRIVNQEIQDADLPQPIFQSFAVLLPVGSVTATSGRSGTGETVCLRVVKSDDGATASWVPLPATLLDTIGTRLMTEIPGISRVVYDITPKPPGRIEWE